MVAHVLEGPPFHVLLEPSVDSAINGLARSRDDCRHSDCYTLAWLIIVMHPIVIMRMESIPENWRVDQI